MQRTKSQLNAIYYAHRRRLAKLGIDWKAIRRPHGTEAIDID